MIFQLGIPIFRNFLEDEEGKEQGQDTTRLSKIQEIPPEDLKVTQEDSTRLGLIKDIPITDLDAAFAEMQRRQEVDERVAAREGLEAFVETGDRSLLPEDIVREIGQQELAFAPDQLGSAINRSRDRSILQAIGDITPAALPVMLIGGMPGGIFGALAASEDLRNLFNPDIPLPPRPDPQDLSEILDEGMAFALPEGLPVGVGMTEQEVVDLFVPEPGVLEDPGFSTTLGGPLGATMRATISMNRQFEENFLGTAFQLVSAPLVLGYMGMKELLQGAPIARGPLVGGVPVAETDPFRFRLEELRQRWTDDVGRMDAYQAAEARRGMQALLATTAFGFAVKAGLGPGTIFRNELAKGLARSRGASRASIAEILAVEGQGIARLEQAIPTSTLKIISDVERFTNAAGGLATFGFFSAAPGEKFDRAVVFAMSALPLYGALAVLDWGFSSRAFSSMGVGASNPRNPGRAHAIARLGAGRPFDRAVGPVPDIAVETGTIPVGTNLMVRPRAPLADLPPTGEFPVVTPPPRPRTGPNTTLDIVSHPDYVLRLSEEQAAANETRRIAESGIPDPAPIASSAIERIRQRGVVRREIFAAEERRREEITPEVEDIAGVIEDVQGTLEIFTRTVLQTLPEQTSPEIIEILESEAFAERLVNLETVEDVINALDEVAPNLPSDATAFTGRAIFGHIQQIRQLSPTGRRTTGSERRDLDRNVRERGLGGIRFDVGGVVRNLGVLIPPEMSDFMLSDDFVEEFFDNLGEVEALQKLVGEAVDMIPDMGNVAPPVRQAMIDEITSSILNRGLRRMAEEELAARTAAAAVGREAQGPIDRDVILTGDRGGVERREPAQGRREVERRERRDPAQRPIEEQAINVRSPQALIVTSLRRFQGDVVKAREWIGKGIEAALEPGGEFEGADLLHFTEATLEMFDQNTRGMEVVDFIFDVPILERRVEARGEVSRADILALEAELMTPEQLEAQAVQREIEQESAAVRILGEEGAREWQEMQHLKDNGTAEEVARAEQRIAEILGVVDPGVRGQLEGIGSVDNFGIDLLDVRTLRLLAAGKEASSFESLREFDTIELMEMIKQEIVPGPLQAVPPTSGLKGVESFIILEGAFQVLATPLSEGGRGRTINEIADAVAELVVAENPGTIVDDIRPLVLRRFENLVRAFRELDLIPRRVNAPEALVPASIAEDAAIFFRNHGDPVGALVDQLRTKDNQTVVIRGEDTPGRALELARERLGDDIVIAIHRRDVGDVFDIGLGGQGSPFQLPDLKKQFELEGNFNGQEISIDGMPFEYIRRGNKNRVKPNGEREDPRDILVRMGNSNETPIWIARGLLRNIRDIKTINEFAKVAAAQRGLPEKAALRIKVANVSPTYAWLAEYIGDLTRVMTENIIVTKGDFSKVLVTVDRMLEQLVDVQGTLVKINQEVAESSIVRSRPDLSAELRQRLVDARKLESITEERQTLQPTERNDLSRIKQLGRDYAAFHRVIPTINRVQRLAQNAAVAIGEFRFDLALDIMKTLQAELGKGVANWEKVTAQSTTPTIREVLEKVLDPSELKAHDAMRKELQPPTTRKMLEDGWRFTFENMRKLAASNGFILNRSPSGAFTLRDQAGGHDVFHAPNIKDIEQFIRDAGQITGTDYDAAHSIDPNIPGSTMPPPPANARPMDSFPVEPEGYLESLVETITAMLPWITPFRDYAAAVDATSGTTQIFRNVWLPTNPKAFEAAGFAEPFLKTARDINKEMISSGVKRERMETYQDNLETRSEEQLRSSHLQGGSFVRSRDYNPVELALADQLIGLRVSMGRVFDYMDLLLSELERAAKNAGIENVTELPLDVANAVRESVKQSHNATPAEDQALGIFTEIKKADVSDLSLYGITRLVEAHNTGSLSPEDHAIQEGFTAQERDWIERLRDLYDEIAANPLVPISDVQLLQGYIAHVGWRQHADSERSFQRQQGSDPELRFTHNMIRQGEGAPYDRNPIINLANYIRATSRAATSFNKAWTDANNYVQSLPEGQPRSVAESYLGAVRGNLPWESREAQKLFDKWLDKMGWDVELSLRQDVINTALALNSGALIGFRYGLTLRDLTSWLTFHYSRFGGSPEKRQGFVRKAIEGVGIGPTRTIRALRLGFQNFFDSASELRKNGTIPSVGPIQFETPSELLSSGLGSAVRRLPDQLRRFANFGFVMGGQKNMYEALFTGTYLESKEFVGRAAVRYQNNEITKADFYNTIKLNAFNKQVRAEFDDLITLQKFDEAIELISRMSGVDMLGLYGMANHPWGWGTNPGRMIAQFGNWPSSMLQTFLGGMTRGSPSRQAGFAARFAMAQGAMWTTGRTFGMDFGTWFIFPGLFFLGGPAIQVAEDLITAYASNAPDSIKSRVKANLKEDFLVHVDLDDMRNTNINTMWFPSGYFINDYLEARRAVLNGRPLVQGIGRFFNIPPAKRASVYFDGAPFFNQ